MPEGSLNVVSALPINFNLKLTFNLKLNLPAQAQSRRQKKAKIDLKSVIARIG